MTKNANQEDEFYQESDRRSRRRSCCSWQTFILFFVFLAVIAGLLTYYVFSKIKQAEFTLENYYPSTISKEDFLAKLNFDKEKNPTFLLTVTDQELTSLIKDGFGALSFKINEARVAINPPVLIIYGKLTKPLKADVKIETSPTVKEGKIFLKVSQVTAGKLVLPGFLNSEIEKSLNNLMAENFQTLYDNYQVTDIKLEQDQMLISGKVKNSLTNY